MPTLAYVDSFQHRVLAGNSWYETISNAGTPPNHGAVAITFDTGVARTAEHACSLKVAEDGVTAPNIRKNIAQKVVVGSIFFRIAAAPSVQSKMLVMTISAGVISIGMNTNGTMYGKVGSGTAISTAGTYADSLWHRIDYYADTQTGTAFLEWQIDGAAQTQANLALATANMTNCMIGTNTATDTLTFWVSDWVFGHTSADHPLGDHICKKLELNGTGTHAKGAGVFSDQASATTDAALLAAVDDAWDGTTPNLTQTGEDYTQETTADGGTGYVEWTLADPSETTVWGATMGVLLAAEDATTADNCEARLVDAAGTTLATTGALTDPSGSATVYNAYRPFRTADPSGGWSGTSLSGCKIRFGFSTDVAPNPIINSAEVCYAAVPGAAPTVLPPPPTIKSFAVTRANRY